MQLNDIPSCFLCYNPYMKKIIVVVLFILLLAGLWVSSSQTYDQQSLIPTLQKLLPSETGKSLLAKLEFTYWGRTISVEDRGYYYFVEFLIRKAAHFMTFGFLSLVIYWLLPIHSGRFVAAMLLTLIFACADELHQSITGGRTATIQDVYLDMAGALTFLTAAALVSRLLRLRKNRRSRKYSEFTQ